MSVNQFIAGWIVLVVIVSAVAAVLTIRQTVHEAKKSRAAISLSLSAAETRAPCPGFLYIIESQTLLP